MSNIYSIKFDMKKQILREKVSGKCGMSGFQNFIIEKYNKRSLKQPELYKAKLEYNNLPQEKKVKYLPINADGTLKPELMRRLMNEQALAF